MTWAPESLPDLTGKVYLVTGGNSGIGYQTVLGLAKRNAKVYIGARSNGKGAAAIDSIRSVNACANVTCLKMDLMDLRIIVTAADEIQGPSHYPTANRLNLISNPYRKETFLHGLVNNAGIMATPYEESSDHYEAQFQTNYLSYWLLKYHLLPLLIKTARQSPTSKARLVNISSDGHLIFGPPSSIDFNDINQNNTGKGGPWSRYGSSKLANILHSKELNRRFGGTETGSLWTASLHPGTVDTKLATQATGSSFFQTISPILRFLGAYSRVDTAAYTTLYAVASKEFTQKFNGEYLRPVAKVGKASKQANDAVLAKDLWEWTAAEMTKLNLIPP